MELQNKVFDGVTGALIRRISSLIREAKKTTQAAYNAGQAGAPIQMP